MRTPPLAATITLTYLTGRAMATEDPLRTVVILLVILVTVDWLHDTHRHDRGSRFGRLPGPLVDPRHPSQHPKETP